MLFRSLGPVTSATYALTEASPVLTPAGGAYTAAQSVTVTSTTPGAVLTYTLDGTTPTSSSTKYTGPIAISVSETLKVIATGTGYASSPVVTASYVIATLSAAATPTFSLAAGSYTGAQIVSISDATTGATIYYTTDGSTPTTTSAVYAAPLTISATKTLNAVAKSATTNASTVASATYKIVSAAGPVFNYSTFTSSGLSFVGTYIISGALELTDGNNYQDNAAWYLEQAGNAYQSSKTIEDADWTWNGFISGSTLNSFRQFLDRNSSDRKSVV